MATSKKSSEIAVAIAHLRASDRVMRRIVDEVGEINLPKKQEGFKILAHSIISHSLGVAAARTISNRIFALVKESKLTPENILKLTDKQLVSTGLSRPKAGYLKGLAKAVQTGELSFRRLARMPDEEAMDELMKLKGIGPWTAEMYLMFAMGRPDVFPVRDAGLKVAVCKTYGITPDEFPTKGPKIAAKWSPFRTLACVYLWTWRDNKPA